jgi:hypothetical protein
VHQKYLLREFNKQRNKGEFLVIHLNPDIFHTIQRIQSGAEEIEGGQEPKGYSPMELEDLKKYVSGEYSIPFMENYKGKFHEICVFLFLLMLFLI